MSGFSDLRVTVTTSLEEVKAATLEINIIIESLQGEKLNPGAEGNGDFQTIMRSLVNSKLICSFSY